DLGESVSGRGQGAEGRTGRGGSTLASVLTTLIQTAARECERLVTVMKQRLEGTFSGQHEPPVLVQHDPCPEFPAFAIQRLLQPLNILLRRSHEPEIADLQRNDLKADYGGAGRIDGGEVHHRQVASILFVAADTLVVIGEGAAAVNNEPAATDLDTLCLILTMTQYTR